mmetsp:Transcript_36551/g.117203  ORF Transcript_36551/g.117203 Transcript_36551/m.117203 type:complete len:206 (-) Transcript_36551:539-1156(-)
MRGIGTTNVLGPATSARGWRRLRRAGIRGRTSGVSWIVCGGKNSRVREERGVACLFACLLACLVVGRSRVGRTEGEREVGRRVFLALRREGQRTEATYWWEQTIIEEEGVIFIFFLFWRAVPCCVRVSRGTFRCWIVGCSRFWWMLDVGEREKRGLMGQDCGGREDEDAGGWLREDDERRRQAFVGASLSRRKEGEEKRREATKR